MRKRKTGWRYRSGVRVVPRQRDYTEKVKLAYGAVDAMGRPTVMRLQGMLQVLQAQAAALEPGWRAAYSRTLPVVPGQ